MKKKKIIIGIILFIFSYILWIILNIKEQVHIFDLIGIVISITIVLIYILFLFFNLIYKKIKSNIIRKIFLIIILIMPYTIYIVGCNIATNIGNWTGFGFALFTMFLTGIFFIFTISFFIILIYNYFKNKRKK